MDVFVALISELQRLCISTWSVCIRITQTFVYFCVSQAEWFHRIKTTVFECSKRINCTFYVNEMAAGWLNMQVLTVSECLSDGVSD